MRRKVLVVDDDPSILRSTGLMLEARHDVVLLDRADLVVPLARQERPDVLLQDARMPGLDLDGIVRAIRADPALRRVRVILYTAALEGADIARRHGLPLLEKPCGPADFERALGSAAHGEAASGARAEA